MIANPHVKVNLGLSVLRKRPDGYHDLETLFVPYKEIHDVLEIVAGDDYSHTSASLFARYGEGEIAQAISEDGKLMITIARKEGVDWDPLKDLTARAYFLLAADFDLPPVKIFLEKLSPVGAGLGGGSSDAAFALMMINDMFSLGLDKPALARYAAELGSDCAFFVFDGPMFGEGRGEILSPYEGEAVPQGYELKVIVPEDVAVSTADAYRGIVPIENGQRPVSLREALARPVGEWKDVLSNDFEKTVFAKHPELAAIKDSLYESGAVYAAMSGSGSALFAIYKV